MENQELIQDTGLFVGQKIFEFSLSESYEAITNIFQTIKEYREYTSPDKAAWFEYIHQIFQIFGFNTVKVAQRIIILQEMGTNHSPKALVCIIEPNEDFYQMIYGLSWESYLFYAARYHKVDWVILTNGLQFKVLNFGDNADDQKYFKCELDEIIKNGKTDNFFTLYKIISIINRSKEEETIDQKVVISNPNEKGERVIVERHLIRKEFWTQLLSRSKSQTKLFSSKKSPGIENYLSTGSGKKGVYFNYIITYEGARVELYIDNGDANWNKNTFDTLFRNKPEIEKSLGSPLVWERLDDKRASVIRFLLNEYSLKDKDNWPVLQDQMIDAMIRFEKALRPYLQ